MHRDRVKGLVLGLILVGFVLLAPPVHGGGFRLQILHASDLEGGVDAIADAPNFAAVVEALEREAQARWGIPSILVSAGDNYIPGPFFSASDSAAMKGALRAAYQEYFNRTGLTGIREGPGRVDLTIMNLIGFRASALGNHEFDPGTRILGELIAADAGGRQPGALRWPGAQFPYLSANLDFSGDPHLKRLFTERILPSTDFAPPPDRLTGTVAKIARAVTLHLGGDEAPVRVGIVGATTPMLTSISFPGDTRVLAPGAGGDDMAALARVLQPVIDDLMDGDDDTPGTGDDIDKVLLLAHLQQISRERRLARYLRGVDIIVAGGSDTVLADDSDVLRRGDIAGGPYPMRARDRDGAPVLVVGSGGQYKYVGRLVVEFDGSGRVAELGGAEAERINGSFSTDDEGVVRLWGNLAAPFAPGAKGARVRALTDAVRGTVIAKDSNVLATTSVFLEGRRPQVRREETNLGSLSADALLFAARAARSGAVAALKNGGGIRAGIGVVDTERGVLLPPAANPVSGKPAGGISQLDIENALKFNNKGTLLTVTAAGLKSVLEYAVSASSGHATPGRFPQVGGMAFSFDPARDAIVIDGGKVIRSGQRVRSLAVLGGGGCDVVVRDGRLEGDAGRPIRLVTLDFLAEGGDGYPFPLFAVDREDLTGEPGQPAGAVDFAPAGSEQDALAEYLVARFSAAPFSIAETPPERDLRIQNLARRPDTVFDLGPCR